TRAILRLLAAILVRALNEQAADSVEDCPRRRVLRYRHTRAGIAGVRESSVIGQLDGAIRVEHQRWDCSRTNDGWWGFINDCDGCIARRASAVTVLDCKRDRVIAGAGQNQRWIGRGGH